MACREMNEDVAYSRNSESGCKCYYCVIMVYSVLIVFSLKFSIDFTLDHLRSTILGTCMDSYMGINRLLSVIAVYSILIYFNLQFILY